MDELLQNRYRRLFQIYGAGGDHELVFAKGLIFEKFEGESAFLRADAALLLRPYGGYVPDSDSRPMPLPKEFRKPGSLRGPIQEALNLIFDRLEGERPYSAHAVARSVESAWEQLQHLFGWA